MKRIAKLRALSLAFLLPMTAAGADEAPFRPFFPPREVTSVVVPGARVEIPTCRAQYPSAALYAGAQGITRVRVTLDATGRVVGTEIVGSAGRTAEHHLLDIAAAKAWATCSYKPPRDAQDNAVAGQIEVQTTWRIE